MSTTPENEKSATGWGVYVVEAGIIRQRYPGRYREKGAADRAAAVYQTAFDQRRPAVEREFQVLPWDGRIPA